MRVEKSIGVRMASQEEPKALAADTKEYNTIIEGDRIAKPGGNVLYLAYNP